MDHVYRACRNVLTPHGPESYPGLLVVRPGPGWQVAVICPNDGETIVALGGERVYGYQTAGGVPADAFELSPGDRATIVASGLPAGLSEWRVERAGP